MPQNREQGDLQYQNLWTGAILNLGETRLYCSNWEILDHYWSYETNDDTD